MRLSSVNACILVHSPRMIRVPDMSCTIFVSVVKAREWSIRMMFHAGSMSQFPRFESMLQMRLSNMTALRF